MNSSLKEKTTKYKNEIKTNFKSYNDNKKDSIQTKNFHDILNVMNSNKKNKFINDSIKSLITLKQEENDDNISPEEYISFIENQLDNNEENDGLKNIFNALCDTNNEKISWNSLPQIAKELGDDEVSNNLMNVIKQSKLYLKDFNYEEFFEIMNAESEDEKEEIEIKSNNIDNTNINNKIQYEDEDEDEEVKNIKINDYLGNYEEKPIYKQKKIIQNKNKEYEEEISSSSKSMNKISDDIIIEEKSEDTKTNENNEVSNDNEKIYKRYHRRYRSKKAPNYNNENKNTENINYNHKSLNKYRKKHSYH